MPLDDAAGAHACPGDDPGRRTHKTALIPAIGILGGLIVTTGSSCNESERGQGGRGGWTGDGGARGWGAPWAGSARARQVRMRSRLRSHRQRCSQPTHRAQAVLGHEEAEDDKAEEAEDSQAAVDVEAAMRGVA